MFDGVLGLMRGFPSVFFSGYSIGTGMAGVLGATWLLYLD